MTTSPLAWDESGKSAHWRNRHKDQSFFSVFNFYVTHESNIWKNKNNYSKEELEKISKPDFLPDNDKIKIDLLTNYKNIEKLDQEIGVIINQLKEDSLYDNTIIFFFSDHGGPFPKYKRSIYETGIRVPMIAKWITDTIKRNQKISLLVLLILLQLYLKLQMLMRNSHLKEFPLKKKNVNIYMLQQIALMNIQISAEVFAVEILN